MRRGRTGLIAGTPDKPDWGRLPDPPYPTPPMLPLERGTFTCSVQSDLVVVAESNPLVSEAYKFEAPLNFQEVQTNVSYDQYSVHRTRTELTIGSCVD